MYNSEIYSVGDPYLWLFIVDHHHATQPAVRVHILIIRVRITILKETIPLTPGMILGLGNKQLLQRKLMNYTTITNY